MTDSTRTRETETDSIDDTTLEQMANLMFDGLQQGATLKELKDVSDDMLESVYTYAHRFYSNGQLDEAETFFRFLYLYDFYNGEYALGLAAVHQMKKDYAKAIDLYALAYTLLKDDERPMLHVGQCHLALGKLSLAKGCFETVQQRSSDSVLVQRAGIYLQAVAAGGNSGSDSGNDYERETP